MQARDYGLELGLGLMKLVLCIAKMFSMQGQKVYHAGYVGLSLGKGFDFL